MNFDCDKISCISLTSRLDKRWFFSNLMKELNIQFDFFDAINNKEKPYKGCFESHFKIISNAYKNSDERIMIFEDDVDIRPNLHTAEIVSINNFLNTNNDWEIFLLGSTPNIWTHSIKEVSKNIYHGSYIGAYAYIINRKGIERYKNMIWGCPHKYVDRDVFSKNPNIYAYMPELYVQRIIKNDIGHNSYTFIKYRTKILDLVDWYAININIPLYILIIVFICVLILMLIKRYKDNKHHSRYTD